MSGRRNDDVPDPISKPLERILRSLGGAGVAASKTVFTGWRDIVGDNVAEHCRPVSLDRGCLLVAVDDPGWATTLRYDQSPILERCRDRLGEGSVTRIEVVVRPRPKS